MPPDDPAAPAAVDPAAPAAPAGDAPYAEYLQQVPEELREQVEPAFKAWDGQVTKRFQDAADYRKQWEPFEKVGVQQMDPAHIEWAKAFIEAQQTNPQAIAAWYEEWARGAGLAPQEQAPQLDQDPEIAAFIQRQIEAALNPVTQQLGGLTQWQQQQEQQARERAAQATIESQLAALPEGTPRDKVEMFVARHMDDPGHAIEKAFADYTAFVAGIEKGLLGQKLGQAPGALSGGAPSTGLEPIKFADTAAIAKERLRASRS